MIPGSMTEFAGGAAFDGVEPCSPTGPIFGSLEPETCTSDSCEIAVPCIHKAMHIESAANLNVVCAGFKFNV
jgi:hypothetical protein